MCIHYTGVIKSDRWGRKQTNLKTPILSRDNGLSRLLQKLEVRRKEQSFLMVTILCYGSIITLGVIVPDDFT